MPVRKFTLTKENYELAKLMKAEIENTVTIRMPLLVRIHKLATILTGQESSPGCSSCNRKAIENIKAYTYQYELEYDK